MSRFAVALMTVFALAGFANQAQATAVFSGSGSGLSASASFKITGGQLTILLTNTDADSATTVSSVLTGLFFNLGTSTFTPSSASVYTGSPSGVVQQGSIIQTSECDVQSCTGQTNIGGEWSYASGGVSWLSDSNPAMNHGISTADYLNANTGAGNFGGSNYFGSAGLGGIGFGLMPNLWAPWGGNDTLDDAALIEGTVAFVLNIPNGLQESDISNVYFVFGDSSDKKKIPGTPTPPGGTSGGSIPEPALLSMLGVALAGAAFRLRRPGARG